jgi:hypothetical protein
MGHIWIWTIIGILLVVLLMLAIEADQKMTGNN